MSLETLIEQLSKAPDGQFDKKFADMCAEFIKEETDDLNKAFFLRNILDACVRYAASSSFVITLIRMCLEHYPEDASLKKARRNMFESWESGKIPKWLSLEETKMQEALE